MSEHTGTAIVHLQDLEAVLRTDGTAGARAVLTRAASRPLRLSDRASLGALRATLSAHQDDLEADPSLLCTVAYPFLLCASLTADCLSNIYGALPLPEHRLHFPVVLPGDSDAALSGIKSPVQALATCAGRVAAASHRDGFKVWLEDGTTVASLGADLPDVLDLCWPDEDHILTGHEDGSLRLWSLADLTAEVLPGTGRAAIRCCAGSPAYLVGAGDDGCTRVWSRQGGSALNLSGQEGRILSCAIWQERIATGSSKGEIVLWGLSDDVPTLQIPAHSGAVHSCTFHPEGHTLLSTGEDGTLRGWRVVDGTAAFAATDIGAPGQAIRVSSDGDQALTAQANHVATQWSLWPVQPLGVLLGHKRPVIGVDWGADPHTVWTAGRDRIVRRWGPGDLKHPGVALHHSGSIRACAFSPDGQVLAAGSRDGSLSIWDLTTGECRHLIECGHLPVGQGSALYDLAFSPSGTQLIAVATSGIGSIWDVQTGDHMQYLQATETPATCCTFLAEGRVLIGGRDNRMQIWNLETGEIDRVLEGHSHWVRCCATQPGTGHVLSGSYDGTLRLWDLSTGHTIRVLEHHTEPVVDCGISASGRQAASIGLDGQVVVWDLQHGTVIHAIAAHGGPGAGLAWGKEPDSEVVTVGQDRWVRGWDIATGMQTFSFPVTSALDSVAYNENHLAVGDRAGNLWVFQRP